MSHDDNDDADERKMLRCVLVNTKPQTIRCLLAKQANTVIWFGRSLSLSISLLLSAECGMCVVLLYVDILIIQLSLRQFYTQPIPYVSSRVIKYSTVNVACVIRTDTREETRQMHVPEHFSFIFFYFCIILLNKKTLCDGCNVLFSKPKQPNVAFCRFCVFCRFCRCFLPLKID